ncbi:hypothetical protein C8R44DRAFT_723807 [Mycena epipterygia]|nr:hypothetical protein C8R44DRAFT_723807 [Mycena epipterygia]
MPRVAPGAQGDRIGYHGDYSGPTPFDSDLREPATVLVEMFTSITSAAFKTVPSTDPAAHSIDNYNIPAQAVNEACPEVDDTISASAADKMTSVPAAARARGGRA